ncbi:hypothetical protein CDL15_Pgr019019 [Punica granatum]|uniref:FAF domain-containing protein n=1 Tax=Punica granatum TaxID=22663 RepID=A0A218XJM0_PUNGR|nr:hypothetical protein CDL15_Pgr019019 [Punica granatum]
MITSLCKKGLHSFLGFTNLVDSPPPPVLHPSLPAASKGHALASGIGLTTATGEFPRGPNVVESTALCSPPPLAKEDPSLSSFVDEVGGGVVVDGLMSCTESLGFESSDDIWADEWYPAWPAKPVERTTRLREASERREKKFPPPISSLNHKGQRSFFFRPVRTEGRLELAEVRIDCPEILRASREDGRLRLDLIVEEDMETEEQEKEQEETIEEEVEGEKQEEVQEDQDRVVELFQEGIRIGRCHDVVNHHSRCHHHHHHNHSLGGGWRKSHVPPPCQRRKACRCVIWAAEHKYLQNFYQSDDDGNEYSGPDPISWEWLCSITANR